MKMKLLWCNIAAILLSTIANAAVDVEKTVQQVQSILQSNSLLPQLSREEIIQLLNDIRAEDAKSTSTSTEHFKEEKKEEIKLTTPYSNDIENEINPMTQLPDITENIIEKDTVVSASAPSVFESTTKKGETTVMVVLPYTPRDGSSLQELYTRPPRVEVVPVSKVTPKPIRTNENDKLVESLKRFNQAINTQNSFPDELQSFLDAHGLKGNPGQDHFFLPLDGFKPLPPAKVIDGSVQLPENILLAYDLISPNSDTKPAINNGNVQTLSQNNFLYEPLRPQYPFELDTSSSEIKKTVLPLDLPKSRKTKSTNSSPKPNYQPIDYDSVRVIPLPQGPSPLDDERIISANDLNKRQTNATTNIKSNNETTTEPTLESTTNSNDPKNAITNAPVPSDSIGADTDTGASIADLEDSFGGAAEENPGDSELPPPKKNGFYWMLDWNSFLEVGDDDKKVNIRFEPKLGDPQMFLPVTVP